MPKKKPTPVGKCPCPRPPGKPRSRVKMPDAMRARGLGELELADRYGHLVDRLDKPAARKDKLLLETLKEVGKLLEAYPTGRGPAAGLEPVQIVLDVPRPIRGDDSSENSAT